VLVALVAAVSSLAGVLLGNVLTMKAEQRRREFEATERDKDRTLEHRARLHADRLDAYRTFARASTRSRAADHTATQWFGRRQYLLSVKPLDPVAIDHAQEEWARALETAAECTAELIDSLTMVQYVASTPVFEAARDLFQLLLPGARLTRSRNKMAQTWEDGSASVASVDAWQEVQAAEGEVVAAEARLADAIRAELALDR
jgi:hypothetical protein